MGRRSHDAGDRGTTALLRNRTVEETACPMA
jgi:hypothetical protein